MVHIYLVWPMNGTVGNVAVGKLHYTHWVAHRSETIGIKTAKKKKKRKRKKKQKKKKKKQKNKKKRKKNKEKKKKKKKKLLVDALEREFPEVFVEPTYPIVKGRDSFRIKLLD